jgi:hypothetical protein
MRRMREERRRVKEERVKNQMGSIRQTRIL